MASLQQVPSMLRRPYAVPALLGAAALSLACASRGPVSMDAAAAAAAVVTSDSGSFITMLGADTVSVERFTRTATTLEGDFIARVPMTRVIHYSATLAPDGTIRTLETEMRPGAALQGPPMQRATVAFIGDSARIDATAGANTATATIAARRGAFAIPAVIYALIEQGALQHRRAGADSSETDIVFIAGRQTSPISYVRRGADSLTIYFRGNPLLASVDSRGRLTGLDGIRTTEKVTVRRVPPVDLERTVAAFVERDRGGRGMGQLSPRDTVTATVGTANVSINYSRPARRGRAIFGSVVPWNQVWRTGANAATSLTTSADISIGGVAVPAGSYTLFTLPSPAGTKLIISSQTGQWGTQYDPAKDFARVDLAAELLPMPVEQFTIDLVPSGAGAQLQLSWDRTRFSVPITAR